MQHQQAHANTHRERAAWPDRARGPQVVTLSGVCKKAFDSLGLSVIKVSISHSGEFAVAQATAGR